MAYKVRRAIIVGVSKGAWRYVWGILLTRILLPSSQEASPIRSGKFCLDYVPPTNLFPRS